MIQTWKLPPDITENGISKSAIDYICLIQFVMGKIITRMGYCIDQKVVNNINRFDVIATKWEMVNALDEEKNHLRDALPAEKLSEIIAIVVSMI